MIRRIFILSLVLIGLMALNSDKFGIRGFGLRGAQIGNSDGIRVVDQPGSAATLSFVPTAVLPEAPSADAGDMRRVRDVTAFLDELIVERRRLADSRRPANRRSEVFDQADYRRRVQVRCTNGSCLISTNPGHASVTADIVAMLVTIESGVKNRELQVFGVRSGKIVSHRQASGDLTVDLPLERLT